ncbi:L,D-transpeptidase family protein [Rhizobium herbae]|jgi:lipoprotein-anchoring transpeptidase ErfK/SrfK
MNTHTMIVTIGLILTATSVPAKDLSSDAVNSTSVTDVPTKLPVGRSIDADPAIVRLQVLLDRAGASPGVIDGFYGQNVRRAVEGFEALNGFPVDGNLDADVIALLERNASPIIRSHVVTDKDANGLVDRVPEDYGEKSKMDNLGYTSVAEKLAEQSHMHIELLKALNPSSVFGVGDTIQLVDIGSPRTGAVKRIVANKRKGQVLAFAADKSLLAVYPATIGSDDNPSPSGIHKVKGVARMPVYRYDPKKNFKQGDNDQVLTIPKGPNGPVGTVWIDLTEPTYGIHGTPEPEFIGKVGSHGCLRLTNWDVEELAGMVKPGVIVEFSD